MSNSADARTTQHATRNTQHDPIPDPATEYRKLPAVDALLRRPDVAALTAQHSPAQVTQALRGLLDEARAAIADGGSAPAEDAWPARLADHLAALERPTLGPAINATGVIVHTNLGRAPLSQAARQAVADVAAGYSNLEFDLESGSRGSRYDHSRDLLCRLTGAEDALVVNNAAGAVFLVLAALCRGRDVLISRGQLVEIGGGFRIPDVLRQSGARLVEVGTTNRTHPRDFSAAIGEQTGAVMRIHSSNFKQIGFVTEPSLDELAEIVRAFYPDVIPPDRPILIDDLGSGSLLETAAYGLAPEPTIQASIAAGVDLVVCSGDKLLGGPQAGLILGRADLIAQLRRFPLLRALRVDKMTLAALDATLRSYQRGRAVEEIPVWRMMAASAQEVAERAETWRARLAALGLSASVRAGESAVGGGSLPGETLPTTLLALVIPQPDQAAYRLRTGPSAVVCRIQDNALLFDPRTVLPDQDDLLIAAIAEVGIDGWK